jgi:hypothetical protein
MPRSWLSLDELGMTGANWTPAMKTKKQLAAAFLLCQECKCMVRFDKNITKKQLAAFSLNAAIVAVPRQARDDDEVR